MLPATAITDNASLYYTAIKGDCEVYVTKQPESYPTKAYHFMSRAIKMVTDTVVPTITQQVPQQVSEVVKTHFSKATCAFAFGCIYDMSWLLNVASSVGTINLDRDHGFRATPLVRDTAICMLALHTFKAGSNVWSFFSSPNLPAVVGCLFDIASIVAVSHIIENKEPQNAAEPEKIEKKD